MFVYVKNNDLKIRENVFFINSKIITSDVVVIF